MKTNGNLKAVGNPSTGRNKRSEYYLKEAAEYGPENERMKDLQKRLKSDYLTTLPGALQH